MMNKTQKFLSFIIALAAVAFGGVSLYAQPVNRVPSLGFIDYNGDMYVNTSGLLNTYGATSIGLSPSANSTDIVCLTGSATKTVKLTQVMVSGTAKVAITVPVSVRLNSAADTSGTAATGRAIPYAYSYVSSQTAATATLTAYTASPTLNTASPGIVGSTVLSMPTTASGVASPTSAQFSWGNRGGSMQPTLAGVAQQACVSLAGTTLTSGVSFDTPLINVTFEWQEY